MKSSIPLCLAVLVGSAAAAAADPIVFNTARLTTSGVFHCFNLEACSASGNTVTLGAGDSAVTLTFTGVTTMVPVSNEALPVSLGTLSTSSSSATFPAGLHPLIPIVGFNLTLAHEAPFADDASLGMNFGPGGRTELGFMQGGTYLGLNPGPVPPGYDQFVYSLSPDVFSVPLNGSVAITAAAGAVPEPGTILLVGSGLLMGYQARKRRQRRRAPRGH